MVILIFYGWLFPQNSCLVLFMISFLNSFNIFVSFLGKIKMFGGISKSASLLARDKAPHIRISQKPRPYFGGMHNRHHVVFPHKSYLWRLWMIYLRSSIDYILPLFIQQIKPKSSISEALLLLRNDLKVSTLINEIMWYVKICYIEIGLINFIRPQLSEFKLKRM